MPITIPRSLALLAVFGWACGDGEARLAERDLGDSTKTLLENTLSSRLSRSDVPVSFDRSLIAWDTVRSEVLPGLIYTWAVYRPQGLPHAYSVAVAARNGGVVRVLTGPDDWFQVTAGWYPKAASEARNACVEIVRTTSQARDPQHPAIRVKEASQEILAMPRNLQDAAARALADSDVVSELDPGGHRWVVEIWMFEVGRSTRYQCTLGPSPQEKKIVETDRLEGVGWFSLDAAPDDSG